MLRRLPVVKTVLADTGKLADHRVLSLHIITGSHHIKSLKYLKYFISTCFAWIFFLKLLLLGGCSDPRVARDSLNCSLHVPWQSPLIECEPYYENNEKLWTMKVVMVVHITDCCDTYL